MSSFSARREPEEHQLQESSFLSTSPYWLKLMDATLDLTREQSRLESDNDIKETDEQERMLQDLYGEGEACLAGQCTVLFFL